MGAGSPLIQLTISSPSSRLQQSLTGEGICRQLWGLRRHNYCSPVISPVTSHIVDIIISKAPTVWVFRWRKCEDPFHLPLRLLSKPGECQPNPPGTQTFNSLSLLVRRKNSFQTAFKQLCNFRERTFTEILLELGFANTVVQPLKTW